MTGDGPVIRHALSNDAAAVAACVTAAYEKYIERMGKPPGPMLDDYAEVIKHHQVFVLALVDAIIGVLVLKRQTDGLLLDNIAVRPDHQGLGHGRCLVAFAEDEARRLGYDALNLYTHESMIENVALYRALGYAETDRRVVGGYARVYMRKDLSV